MNHWLTRMKVFLGAIVELDLINRDGSLARCPGVLKIRALLECQLCDCSIYQAHCPTSCKKTSYSIPDTEVYLADHALFPAFLRLLPWCMYQVLEYGTLQGDY